MKGVKDHWSSKVHNAESKAVSAIVSAEGSAETKRDAHSGATAMLQDKLSRAKQKLKKATDDVEAIEKDLREQRKQPEKVDESEGLYETT